MANIDTYRRGILPKATPEQIDSLLWSCSAYPFAKDTRRIRRSIRNYLKRGGGTIAGAINESHEEMDRDFTQYMEQQSREQADGHH